MNIHGLLGAYGGYAISQQNKQQAAEQAAQAQAEKGNENGNAAEKNAERPQDIWKELGKNVNVRGMTMESMSMVSMTLYDSDQITLFEHSVMSFNPEQGMLGEKGSHFKTEENEEGQRDWIAEFRARLEQHESEGNQQAAAMDKRILSILERLEAAAAGGLNLQV